MKNYVVRNNRNNGYDFWDDAFDNFFRPAFYEGKRGEMKTDIKENENAYVMEVEAAGFDKKRYKSFARERLSDYNRL